MASFGDVVDGFSIGAVRVLVRYGCIRRDQYELRTDQALPDSLREQLAALGVVRGTAILYTVDVPGAYQLTVAPARGRLVLMPRISVERTAQRASAEAVARLIAGELDRPCSVGGG